MDKATLEHRTNRLKGAAAMGGFVITAAQAQRAVIRSDEDMQRGQAVSIEQARSEVRQLNHSVVGRRR